MIPAYPMQGHVIPAVHLALRLAERGFAVTFVNTESVHHRIGAGADIFAGARARGFGAGRAVRAGERRIPSGLRPVAEPPPVHGRPPARAPRPRRGAAPPRRRGSGRDVPRRRHVLRVARHAGAEARRAVRVVLDGASAHLQPLLYHMDLTQNGHFRCNEPRKDTITYIPGVPAIEPGELMSFLQKTDKTSVAHRIIFKAFEEARGADLVVCNTVEELEPSVIAALRAEKPFYAVGPILPAGFARSAVATSLGARFLWVLRPDVVSSDDPDPLPEGFAAAGRGLVVPWCCQVEVLSHAAVGGFLTHCGWNSILESVWAGVPMLCFPLLADQITNRRLVDREWRAGASVGDRGAVRADEVRARIEGLMMGGEEGARLREQVGKLRATLQAAGATGGSSRRTFDEFVDELKRRCGGGR
ncbi:hypothetical protein EJB05_31221, partial [Eragrostis curvula]